jgi:hypothetical protein
VVATSGKSGKWDRREKGSNRRKPLPWVATRCREQRMVRVVSIRPPSCYRGGHLPRSEKRDRGRHIGPKTRTADSNLLLRLAISDAIRRLL